MPGVNAKVKKPRRTPREWFKKYFLEGNLHKLNNDTVTAS